MKKLVTAALVMGLLTCAWTMYMATLDSELVLNILWWAVVPVVIACSIMSVTNMLRPATAWLITAVWFVPACLVSVFSSVIVAISTMPCPEHLCTIPPEIALIFCLVFCSLLAVFIKLTKICYTENIKFWRIFTVYLLQMGIGIIPTVVFNLKGYCGGWLDFGFFLIVLTGALCYYYTRCVKHDARQSTA